MMALNLNSEYHQWITEVKSKIRSTQLKAVWAVNGVLIQFYWDLGGMIAERQTAWGTKFLEQISADLKSEFPDMQGFSVTNLKYCRLFNQFCAIRPQVGDELTAPNSPQPGDEMGMDANRLIAAKIVLIPWGHIKLLIDKVKEPQTQLFYILQTIHNNWSRDVLALQLKGSLHSRQGKAVNNFAATLPQPQSDLAQQTIKDPYLFDFIAMAQPYNERDIENQLVNHISKFLLELGKGFAFMGRQYHLEVAGNDYYIDLLFYHVVLKAYVVIELKNTRFMPEYAGKLNFYLSAVDSLVKRHDDKPTIGILLCRDKNNIEAEFALRDIGKPMGVSEFQLTEILPDNLKASLPTIEELEHGLKLNNHE